MRQYNLVNVTKTDHSEVTIIDCHVFTGPFTIRLESVHGRRFYLPIDIFNIFSMIHTSKCTFY